MNVRFVVQARLQSTRLPRKVLMPIGGRSLLEHIFERMQRVAGPQLVMFAVPAEEDELKKYLLERGYNFRGGEMQNVLSRYLDCSNDLRENDFVFRLTADNPFVDFAAARATLEFLSTSECDYVYPAGLPLGMGFEAIRVAALRKQSRYHLRPHHTEHVTMFIKENPALFKIAQLPLYPDQYSEKIRLTIDEETDLRFARKIYDTFNAAGKPEFCAGEVYELYRREPGFFSDNILVRQKSPKSYEKK